MFAARVNPKRNRPGNFYRAFWRIAEKDLKDGYAIAL